jgi:hypothetical protein
MPIDRIKRYPTLAAMLAAPRKLTGALMAPAVELAFVDGVGLYVRDKNAATFTIPGQPGSLTAGFVQDVIAEGTLTNAQIKAIRATPVTIVAAPGVGFMLRPNWLQLFLDYGTNVLTEATANLDLRYVGVASPVFLTVEMTGFIDQAADTFTSSPVGIDKIFSKANSENKGLELFNNGAGEFGGNAGLDTVIRWKISYSIVPSGF